MEVDQNLCSYALTKSALPARQGFDGYRCEEQKEFAKSLCIFHDPDPNKDKGMVCSEIKSKVDQCYIGYVFPKGIQFPFSEFHEADFAYSHFHEVADFRRRVFHGTTDFTGAEFHRQAQFEEAKFEGEVNFSAVQFAGKAWFNNSTFDGYLKLNSAYFLDEVWFAGVFNVIAVVVGSVFQRDAHFHNTVFAAGSFIETQFKGTTTFGYFKHMEQSPNQDIAKEAPNIIFFEGVDMKHLLFREANLANASFNLCYNLDQAKFYDCDWNTESGRRHVLYDELVLRGEVIPWEEMAEREIRSHKSKSATNVANDRVEGSQSKESLHEGKYAAVEETCRALKKHFEDRRNYLVAGDFHEGEMEMRRLAKGPWRRNLLSVEAVYWRLSRYGQRWLRPLGWLLGLLLLAAAVYAATGLRLSGNGHELRWNFGQELSSELIFDWLYVYSHSLLYSISVTALMRGILATPTHLLGLLVQTVEFILGPMLLFLIGVAIRRRLRR